MIGRRSSIIGYERDPPAPFTITLVIPAHNEEAYIGACLDAVVAHAAGRVCEIIVVDNDSNDRTGEIVRRYEHVTNVFEPSKGITKARQRGYQSARGDILAFVDADTIPPGPKVRACALHAEAGDAHFGPAAETGRLCEDGRHLPHQFSVDRI